MDRQNRTQWFSQLAQRLGISQAPLFNLLIEVKIDEDRLQKMRKATTRYIRACLGIPGDSTLDQALLETAADKLVNRTPNGILMPKQEFQREFNQLHKDVASYLRSLRIDDLIDKVFCPITLRLAKGQRNIQEEARPYASTKLHVDLWTGDPADSVNVHIPILGDIQRTTVDFYHPPDGFEKHWLRVLSSYDEGKELEGLCREYPVSLRHGYAYFADAILPHRTVRNKGGARTMIEFRLRRQTSDEEKNEMEGIFGKGRLNHYISVNEWYEYGNSKFMKFKDTYADAAKGIFTERPYDEPIYDVVDSV